MKTRSGQTLIEVMIALFLLTTGLLGILTLLSQSIFLSKTQGNESIATYLAAEGIEVAKSLIDHDVYQHVGGLGAGWGSCFNAGGSFEVDYTTTDCTTLPVHQYFVATPPDFLSYDPSLHVYLYAFNNITDDPLVSTIFARGIKVIPNGGNEITVISEVWWNVGSPNQQSVSVEDHFYNWHP